MKGMMKNAWIKRIFLLGSLLGCALLLHTAVSDEKVEVTISEGAPTASTRFTKASAADDDGFVRRVEITCEGPDKIKSAHASADPGSVWTLEGPGRFAGTATFCCDRGNVQLGWIGCNGIAGFLSGRCG